MSLRRNFTPLLTGVRSLLYRDVQRTAHSSYDDDRDLGDVPKGTHLNFLNDLDTEHPHLYINKYSSDGFTLSTGIELLGSVVFFPRSFVNWKVQHVTEINEESLSLFKAIHPKLDILIIGTGTNNQTISKDVIKYLRENRINFEVLPTEKAVPTFNFLSAEQRWVAAALIPPDSIVDSLSRDINEQLEADEERALLEADDDEGDIQLINGRLIVDKLKGADDFYLKGFPEQERPEKNMFGYKIQYDFPSDKDGYSSPSDSQPQPTPNKSQKSREIRYIRRSDTDYNKVVPGESEKLFVVRSPLEMSRKVQEDVTEPDSGQKTDTAKDADNDPDNKKG